MAETLNSKKIITVYEMNRFLTLADAPLACAVCGKENMLIPAQNDDQGLVYEHQMPVANLPEAGSMTYLTMVCGHCGYVHWFWKERVVALLESIPWRPGVDE